MSRDREEPVSDVWVFIPARRGSERLPDKPLLKIEGKSMIARVAEAVSGAVDPSRIVVVSDSPDVLRASQSATPPPEHLSLINSPCRSGSERVLRAYDQLSASRGWTEARDQWLINVQGDEPLLPPSSLTHLIDALPWFQRHQISIVTLAAPLTSGEEDLKRSAEAQRLLHDPAAVKACLTLEPPQHPGLREALYFTRSPTGSHLHVGVYAFHTSALSLLDRPRTPLSVQEDLEQLTWMEHGARIGVVCLSQPHPPGVDTPEDLKRAREAYRALKSGS